jgi:hypothetical protein
MGFPSYGNFGKISMELGGSFTGSALAINSTDQYQSSTSPRSVIMACGPACNITKGSQNAIIASRYSNIQTGGDISESFIIGGGFQSIGTDGTNVQYMGIVGGRGNTISNAKAQNGATSTVVAGYYCGINGATGNGTNQGLILGGSRTSIRDNADIRNTLIAGYKNYITGGGSGVIMGGRWNEVDNSRNALLGTSRSRSKKTDVTVIGNYYGLGNVIGEFVQPGGKLSAGTGASAMLGEAQKSTIMVAGKTTDELGTAGFEGYTLLHPLNDNSEYIEILPSSTWTFRAQLSAYSLTDDIGAGYIFDGVVRRDGSDSTAIVGVVDSKSWAEGALTGITPTITVDDTNERLNVLVSGLASTEINWYAYIESAQVRGSGFPWNT